jgi:hypothetical protein
MKKIIFTTAVLFIEMTAFSQDIIVTKTNEQIRAKIIEVTDDNISYKKYHDQEGATFVLKTDKIKLISWENGDVDDYEKKILKEEEPVKQEAEVAEEVVKLPFINKKGNTFYLDNGLVYKEVALDSFLTKNNLNHIWDEYTIGKHKEKMGWYLTGIGAGFGIAGTVFFIKDTDGFTFKTAGVIACSIGVVLEAVGIPFALIGTNKKKNAINNYNTLYGGKFPSQYSQNVTFKAGFIDNGLGFQLNF